jgi:hypothetical protein
MTIGLRPVKPIVMDELEKQWSADDMNSFTFRSSVGSRELCSQWSYQERLSWHTSRDCRHCVRTNVIASRITTNLVDKPNLDSRKERRFSAASSDRRDVEK